MKGSKTRTLQQAAFRIECLLHADHPELPKGYREQLQQAHREVKQVRDRLAHERLIERVGEKFLAPNN